MTQEIVSAVHSLPEDVQERLATETDPRALVSRLIMDHYARVDKHIALPDGRTNPARYSAPIGGGNGRH